MTMPKWALVGFCLIAGFAWVNTEINHRDAAKIGAMTSPEESLGKFEALIHQWSNECKSCGLEKLDPPVVPAVLNQEAVDALVGYTDELFKRSDRNVQELLKDPAMLEVFQRYMDRYIEALYEMHSGYPGEYLKQQIDVVHVLGSKLPLGNNDLIGQLYYRTMIGYLTKVRGRQHLPGDRNQTVKWFRQTEGFRYVAGLDDPNVCELVVVNEKRCRQGIGCGDKDGYISNHPILPQWLYTEYREALEFHRLELRHRNERAGLLWLQKHFPLNVDPSFIDEVLAAVANSEKLSQPEKLRFFAQANNNRNLDMEVFGFHRDHPPEPWKLERFSREHVNVK